MDEVSTAGCRLVWIGSGTPPARLSGMCNKLESRPGQQEVKLPLKSRCPGPFPDDFLISSGLFFLMGRKKEFETLPFLHALRFKQA